jgi:hypothetical protein
VFASDIVHRPLASRSLRVAGIEGAPGQELHPTRRFREI